MLLKVDQLKNDELYFFSEDPVHAYYKFFAQVSPQLFGALEKTEGFFQSCSHFRPTFGLYGQSQGYVTENIYNSQNKSKP